MTGAIWVGSASRAAAQVSLDSPPLAETDAKRLDRMEKAVKELRAILFQGRETGQPVVVQPADTQAEIGRLGDRLNDIEQTLTRINGEIEVTRHDLDQTKGQVAALQAQNAQLSTAVATLQKQVQALTPPPPPPTAPAGDMGSPGDSAAVAPPVDPEGQFAAAKAALDQSDMSGAETGFRAYLRSAPDGSHAPEAHYGLARALLSRHAWPDAAAADIAAIRGWPRTRWAPQAVLDLSRALAAMGKPRDACQTLSELKRRYPTAPANVLRAGRQLSVETQCE
jgi:TolA-binding protein